MKWHILYLWEPSIWKREVIKWYVKYTYSDKHPHIKQLILSDGSVCRWFLYSSLYFLVFSKFPKINKYSFCKQKTRFLRLFLNLKYFFLFKQRSFLLPKTTWLFLYVCSSKFSPRLSSLVSGNQISYQFQCRGADRLFFPADESSELVMVATVYVHLDIS